MKRLAFSTAAFCSLVACSGGKSTATPDGGLISLEAGSHARESGVRPAEAAQSIFVVPSAVSALSGASFYDHPWPSDYRLDAKGNLVFTGFPNPNGEPILSTYITAVTGAIQGFSTAAFGYMRFGASVDATTLPASPPDTLAATSSVQIINVDPSSPEHDKRHLAQLYYQDSAGVYWPSHTLAVGPALGYPLLPSTKYAIVVTRGLKASDGTPFSPSPDLSAVLGLTATSPTNKPVHDLFAPALADLAAMGIPASKIAHLTVFTTNDPAAVLFTIADGVAGQIAAPTVLTNAEVSQETGGSDAGLVEAGMRDAGSHDAALVDAGPNDGGGPTASSLVSDPFVAEDGIYDVYRGWYGPAPNYQQGTPPYASGGGDFVFDSQGKAVIQSTFPMRFTLVVPNATACPMPANGYPILMYAHGTGGSNVSVIEEENSVGDAMARQCIASIGTDQIFQGVRPGAPPPGDPNAETEEETSFFNVANPAAFRANTIQSAIDVVEEARLFTETKLTVPASTSVTGHAITFDGTKLLFMGHSQGSLNGPLYFAADPSSLGGVLSGASSDVSITLLDKTSPTPSVATLWLVGLGLDTPDAAAELNLFHPTLSFAQTAMDRIDPLVYMRYLVQAPRAGHAPKSIYQTEGVNPDGTGDTYAPPHGIEVGSVAIGLPVQAPAVHAVAEEPWGGLGPVSVGAGGLSGNLAGGGASGLLAQFVPAAGVDGHYVFFFVPQCRLQAAQFVKNLAANPKGEIPPLSP